MLKAFRALAFAARCLGMFVFLALASALPAHATCPPSFLSTTIASDADCIFRDYSTDGVSASGLYNPQKAQIRQWGEVIGSVAAKLPPFALNINSTFNGINYAGCAASVSCTLYINGAPALAGSFGANPTVRIDRSPTGTGGISGDDTFGLEVVLNAPATDSWTENSGFFILNNRAPIANGTESAALLAQAFKQGNVQVGATWAASFYAWDSTGVAPTSGQGLIGNEIGLAFGVPGAEVNAGTDPFVTRQILKLVCSGLSGTHCGLGEAISTFFAGDVIDTGLCFGTGCNGGNGTFGVGINMTGVFSESAILFSAANQNGIAWANASGVYTPTTAGVQIYSDTSNNLNIENYNGAAITFGTTSGAVMVSMTAASLTVPGLPTSAGSGGITVCVDTTGHFYKKASCP